MPSHGCRAGDHSSARTRNSDNTQISDREGFRNGLSIGTIQIRLPMANCKLTKSQFRQLHSGREPWTIGMAQKETITTTGMTTEIVKLFTATVETIFSMGIILTS